MNRVGNIGFLFDLDGVLIDSESEYTRIWAQINREYPTGIENFEHKIKGCTLSKILNENYEATEIRDKVKDRLHQLENDMHYEFLPGAQKFLIELKNRNLPTALVTSSDDMKMNHLKEELPEIFQYFKFIVSGDLVKSSKPSPEGYILAAGKIDCKPSKCVVFEDSLQGVMAGKNAEAYVVGVTGTIPKEDLALYSHTIVDCLDEIDLDNLILKLETR